MERLRGIIGSLIKKGNLLRVCKSGGEIRVDGVLHCGIDMVQVFGKSPENFHNPASSL